MGCDGMGCDGMPWDGITHCDGMGCDNKMRCHPMRCLKGIIFGAFAQDAMPCHAMGWDGMGWDGVWVEFGLGWMGWRLDWVGWDGVWVEFGLGYAEALQGNAVLLELLCWAG